MYSMKKISLLCAGLLCTNLINGNLGYSAEHSLFGDSISDLEVKNEYKNPFTLFNTSLINGTFSQYVRDGISSILKCGLLDNFSSEESGNILSKFASSFTNRKYSVKYNNKMIKERDYRYFSNKQSGFAEYELECLNAILKDESVCAENLLYIYTKPIEQNNFDYEDIKLLMQLTSALVYKLDINDLVKLISLVDDSRDKLLEENMDYTGNYLSDIECMLVLVGFTKISNEYIVKNIVPDALFDLINSYSNVYEYFDQTCNGYLSAVCKNILGKISTDMPSAINVKQYTLRVLRSINVYSKDWDEFFVQYFQNKEKFDKITYFSAGNFASANMLSALDFDGIDSKSIRFINLKKCTQKLDAVLDNNTNVRSRSDNKEIIDFSKKIKSIVKRSKNKISEECILSNYIFNESISNGQEMLRKVGIASSNNCVPGSVEKVFAFSDIDISTLEFSEFVAHLTKELAAVGEGYNSVLSISFDKWKKIYNQHKSFWIRDGRIPLVYRNIISKIVNCLTNLFKKNGGGFLEELELNTDNIINFLYEFLDIHTKIGHSEDVFLKIMKDSLSYNDVINIFTKILSSVNISFSDVYPDIKLNEKDFVNSFLKHIENQLGNIARPIFDYLTNSIVVNFSAILSNEYDVDINYYLDPRRTKDTFQKCINSAVEKVCTELYNKADREMNINEYKEICKNFLLLQCLLTNNTFLKIAKDYFSTLIQSDVLTQAEIRQFVQKAYEMTQKKRHIYNIISNLNRFNDIRISSDKKALNYGESKNFGEILDSINCNETLSKLFILDNSDLNNINKEFSDNVAKIKRTNMRAYISFAYNIMMSILRQYDIDTTKFTDYKSAIINSVYKCFSNTSKGKGEVFRTISEFGVFLPMCIRIIEKIDDYRINNSDYDNMEDIIDYCILNEDDLDSIKFYLLLINKMSGDTDTSGLLNRNSDIVCNVFLDVAVSMVNGNQEN